MAVSFTAVAEPDKARVVVEARGGIPGESFYLVRRDEEGSSLVRETSESAVVWQADPAGTRTNYVPDPGFERFDAAKQVVYQNLVLNPTCKPNTSVAGNTVRKNYANNPSVEKSLNGWITEHAGGSGTLVHGFNRPISGLGYAEARWATASNRPWGGLWNNRFNVTPGEEYFFSGYVRTSIRQVMRVQLDWRNSASAIQSQAFGAASIIQPFVQPDAQGNGGNTGWTRISLRATVPANITNVTVCFFSSEPDGAVIWPAGSWLQVDGVLIEKSSTLNDYFDGSSGGYFGPEGDLTPVWEGEVDSSMSQLVQYGVQNITGRVSSPVSSMGGTAVAVGKPFTAGQLAAAWVDTAPLVVGGVYTFSAVVHLGKAQTGTLHANARRIGVETTGSATVLSGAVPNVPGSYPVSVTFTATSTTDHHLALFNGSDTGVVSFSELQLTRTPVAVPFFHSGSSNYGRTALDLEWEYTGTATTHNAQYDRATGVTASNAYAASSAAWKRRGGRSLRVIPSAASNASYVQVALTGLPPGTYTVLGHCYLPKVQTGSLNSLARSLNVAIGSGSTFTGGATSKAAPNTAGVVHEVRFTFTIAGAGNVNLRLYSGAAAGGGDVFWDDVAIINGNYTDFYFDGSTHDGDFSGWNGAANASTSYYNFSSLPVTIFDYEARQGVLTSYLLADDDGTQVGESVVSLAIPAWGTWVKDPFRPWMNTRVYWNSDDGFEHSAERTLLLPRGSKYPVALYGRRVAPSSTVVLLTENKDQRERLLALLDTTGVVQLDVDSRFGVPVKYVSVGDFKVTRTGSNDRNLTHESRFFTLPVDEVARPTGAPNNQTITYDSLLGVFSSYLEIPSAVETYDELTEGSWGNDV